MSTLADTDVDDRPTPSFPDSNPFHQGIDPFELQLFAAQRAVDRARETVDELERLDVLGSLDTYPILEDLERELEEAIRRVVKRVGPPHWRRLPGPKVIGVYDGLAEP